MPTYYGILTDFTDSSPDEADLFVGIDPVHGRQEVTVKVYKPGAPPAKTTFTTNQEGFGKADNLDPGTDDALLEVQTSFDAGVSLLQLANPGRLYVVLPSSSQTLGKKFQLVRKGGDFFVLVGNPQSAPATVQVQSGTAAPTTKIVQPNTVAKIEIPSPRAAIQITSDQEVLVQGSIGRGTKSGLIPPSL